MHAASVVLQVDLGEKWRGLGDHLARLAFPDGVEMPDVERQARRRLAQLVTQLQISTRGRKMNESLQLAPKLEQSYEVAASELQKLRASYSERL